MYYVFILIMVAFTPLVHMELKYIIFLLCFGSVMYTTNCKQNEKQL